MKNNKYIKFLFPIPTIVIMCIYLIACIGTYIQGDIKKFSDVLLAYIGFYILFMIPLDLIIWGVKKIISIYTGKQNRAQGSTAQTHQNQTQSFTKNAVQPIKHIKSAYLYSGPYVTGNMYNKGPITNMNSSVNNVNTNTSNNTVNGMSNNINTAQPVTCPRCGGTKITFQREQTASYSAGTNTVYIQPAKRSKGCLYWALIGWWLVPMYWIFIGWWKKLLFGGINYGGINVGASKKTYNTVAICQSCGNSWRVN